MRFSVPTSRSSGSCLHHGEDPEDDVDDVTCRAADAHPGRYRGSARWRYCRPTKVGHAHLRHRAPVHPGNAPVRDARVRRGRRPAEKHDRHVRRRRCQRVGLALHLPNKSSSAEDRPGLRSTLAGSRDRRRCVVNLAWGVWSIFAAAASVGIRHTPSRSVVNRARIFFSPGSWTSAMRPSRWPNAPCQIPSMTAVCTVT